MTVRLAVPRLDVGLVTNEAEAALAFWRDLLGFPVVGEVSFPGFTIRRLAVGESILRIVVPDTPAPRTASTDGFASQTGLRYVTLQVENLFEIFEKAKAAGYPTPHPPREIRPGTWAAQIEDGAGTTVELQQTGVSTSSA